MLSFCVYHDDVADDAKGIIHCNMQKAQFFRLQKQGGIMAFFQILCFHAYDDDDADEKSIIHCNMLNVQFFSL